MEPIEASLGGLFDRLRGISAAGASQRALAALSAPARERRELAVVGRGLGLRHAQGSALQKFYYLLNELLKHCFYANLRASARTAALFTLFTGGRGATGAPC